MKYLYDVCDDYSLCSDVSDKSREQSLTGYKWKDYILYKGSSINDETAVVKLGYCLKTGELHYLKSDDPNLSGEYI